MGGSHFGFPLNDRVSSMWVCIQAKPLDCWLSFFKAKLKRVLSLEQAHTLLSSRGKNKTNIPNVAFVKGDVGKSGGSSTNVLPEFTFDSCK